MRFWLQVLLQVRGLTGSVSHLSVFSGGNFLHPPFIHHFNFSRFCCRRRRSFHSGAGAAPPLLYTDERLTLFKRLFKQSGFR